MRRSANFLGLDYSKVAFPGVCAVCHEPARMTVIDRALARPIGKCCVEVSVNAAVALYQVGLDMPDTALITRNP